jgi:hypothetical protein
MVICPKSSRDAAALVTSSDAPNRTNGFLSTLLVAPELNKNFRPLKLLTDAVECNQLRSCYGQGHIAYLVGLASTLMQGHRGTVTRAPCTCCVIRTSLYVISKFVSCNVCFVLGNFTVGPVLEQELQPPGSHLSFEQILFRSRTSA